MKEKDLIYKMLEEGKITREEADELLEALRKSYGYDQSRSSQPEESDLKEVAGEQAAETTGIGTNQKEEINAETDIESEFNLLDNLSNLFNSLLGPKKSILEEHQGVFRVDEPLIEIDNTNGQTEIFGWDEDFFKLTLEFRTNARTEEEVRKSREQALVYNTTEELLKVKVVSKSFFKNAANIKLFLPRDKKYQLNLSSSNGKTGLKSLKFKKGEIHLTNGKLRVKDVDGDNLELKVTNGMIDFSGGFTNLNARVNNGNINIAPTVRGSAVLEMRTTNGNLKVSLPDESSCYFEGRTKNGVVSNDIAGVETVKSESKLMKRHLVARSNGWEDSSNRIKIEARTVNGNIKVESVS